MAKRKEMGSKDIDPRQHSETTIGRGERTQSGHIERHESPSSAGSEAQVAGILHGSDTETSNDSSSSGRWSNEADTKSHESAHDQASHERGQHPHGTDVETLVKRGQDSGSQYKAAQNRPVKERRES